MKPEAFLGKIDAGFAVPDLAITRFLERHAHRELKLARDGLQNFENRDSCPRADVVDAPLMRFDEGTCPEIGLNDVTNVDEIASLPRSPLPPEWHSTRRRE